MIRNLRDIIEENIIRIIKKEMKKEFAWLDDPDLIEEIVVRNPNSIFDLIEEVRPVPAGTYPPVIEGSDDKLRKICHDTAMRMYGFEGKVPCN